jgi:hypothetical protein
VIVFIFALHKTNMVGVGVAILRVQKEWGRVGTMGKWHKVGVQELFMKCSHEDTTLISRLRP